MRSKIKIDRNYSDRSLALQILRAVKPDNFGAPQGTSIEMKVVAGDLQIIVASDGDLPSFLRTVDDLLICIQAAEGAALGTR